MKQDKYIFFTKNSNIVYNLENLNDLKTHYLKYVIKHMLNLDKQK